MVDNLTRQKRSKVMASIRGKDTNPELAVRRSLWKAGVRYRVQDRSVPGTPDISNKTKRVAVFIDGCFWHGCRVCYREPTSNVSFWRAKLEHNKERRRDVRRVLKSTGWKVLEYWEHDVKSRPTAVVQDITKNLKTS
jgi:DNA mismatch endonuclease (patch repair protein)